MSREIRFRIYDKKRKSYIGDENGFTLQSLVLAPCDGTVDKIEDYVFEQDTGLKDKNGKRICEGDIIKCHLSPISSVIFTGAVEFKPGCIMFKNFADNGSYAFNFLGSVEEVIGNIHENPELLGGEE